MGYLRLISRTKLERFGRFLITLNNVESSSNLVEADGVPGLYAQIDSF